MDEIERLWTARKMDREVSQMSEGWAAYLTQLDESMLEGRGGADWQARGQAVLAGGQLETGLKAALAASMTSEDVAVLIELAEDPLGIRWTEGFLATSAELTDPQKMADAVAALAEADADEAERIARLRLWLEKDPYVDQLAAANLNYYIAFLKSAFGDGAFGPPLSDAMLVDLVRTQSRNHIERTFLETLALTAGAAHAFEPDELDDLLAKKTALPVDRAYEGLFAAYEAVFVPLYAELGSELSRFALEEQL